MYTMDSALDKSGLRWFEIKLSWMRGGSPQNSLRWDCSFSRTGVGASCDCLEDSSGPSSPEVRIDLPTELRQVLLETPELKQAYLVGGSVRDALWNIPVKDYDIEVFGLGYEELTAALSRWGRTDLVGRSFGVVKLTVPSGAIYDFTIPRRDSKIAAGHKGFQVTFDAELGPREAAARRDFTINSLMYDVRGDELLDFFGGEEDLRKGLLRHTSEAFPEDPLRVLRGMQFCGRFKLTAAAETVELARSIKGAYAELATERVREEWFKWAEKSVAPSLGLKYLCATEWIEHFPEINALRGTPQDPEWHPEGDVFSHTCHCCDALAGMPRWQNAEAQARIVYMLAVLCHDFGKPATTHETVRGGVVRIVSPGHEEAGVKLAESFLNRINTPNSIRERILPLVANHMVHYQNNSDRAIRRLAKRLEPETISSLVTIMTADSMGRPPKPAVVPVGVLELEQRAIELAVQERPPAPILQGRHLIAAGLAPGPQFSAILEQAYEAQLAGEFFDMAGAQSWFQKNREQLTRTDRPVSSRPDSP